VQGTVHATASTLERLQLVPQPQTDLDCGLNRLFHDSLVQRGAPRSLRLRSILSLDELCKVGSYRIWQQGLWIPATLFDCLTHGSGPWWLWDLQILGNGLLVSPLVQRPQGGPPSRPAPRVAPLLVQRPGWPSLPSGA
jgi:hypothetical protein